jgi:hypothetical protein
MPSLAVEYATQQHNTALESLQDKGRLGVVTHALMEKQLHVLGGGGGTRNRPVARATPHARTPARNHEPPASASK